MPAKATKRPQKTDDKRGRDARDDKPGGKSDTKAAAKRDAAERPVAPSAAVQKAASERPATVQPVAAERPAPAQPAAAEKPAVQPAAAAVTSPAAPSVEQQLVAAQRQLAELGQHAKAVDDILAERDRKAATLRQQLAASQAEAEQLRTELHTLRETYRCVGRGALAAANQFDAVKRWLPGTIRNVLKRGR